MVSIPKSCGRYFDVAGKKICRCKVFSIIELVSAKENIRLTEKGNF